MAGAERDISMHGAEGDGRKGTSGYSSREFFIFLFSFSFLSLFAGPKKKTKKNRGYRNLYCTVWTV